MKLMIYLPLILAALSFQQSGGVQSEDIQLNIEPASIQIGQPAKLTWNTKQVGSIYLSGFGLVNSQGERTVSPTENTAYMLIAESPSGVKIKSTMLLVTGIKGVIAYPREDDFAYPQIDSALNQKLNVLLAIIQDILQNKLQFSVKQQVTPQNHYQFVTNYMVRNELLKSNEKAIREKRIAYWVDVEMPSLKSSVVKYEVKLAIDYRRQAESTWRKSPDANLYSIEAKKLLSMIKGVAFK